MADHDQKNDPLHCLLQRTLSFAITVAGNAECGTAQSSSALNPGISYSFNFESMMIVTGPSLMSSTFMSAPNSPV